MRKMKVISISLLIMAMLMMPLTVEASLQSRPGVSTLVKKTASNYFLLARQMETSSGPMGLNATIEIENGKVVETSSSNNIDVHMIKNTEWGTVAMLTASAYGECLHYTSVDYDSTTQNASGIMGMMNGKYNLVAGIYSSSYGYLGTADAKYKNVYTTNKAADGYIPGDATYETSGWYGSSSGGFVNYNFTQFMRGFYGIFYYYDRGAYDTSTSYSSRAAIVCGQGF